MEPNLPEIESALSADLIQTLAEVARTAAANAHAPYSRFQVGAALLDAQGRVFTGCNVENASYGLTMCAERVAVGAAIAAGSRQFIAIVIATDTETLTPPCGACRQVLFEFNPAMEIHLAGREGRRAIYRLSQLLPGAFEFKKE